MQVLTKSNKYILIIYLGGIRTIVNSLKSIILVPIRNTAIKLARAEYLDNVFQIHNLSYNSANYGILQARLRRIEYIFTGLERDMVDCVISVPILLVCSYKLLAIASARLIFYPIVLVNACSLFILIPKWSALRYKAFKSDERLNKEVYRLLTNLSRSQHRDTPMQEVLGVLDKDIAAYCVALVTKQWYRIALVMPNITALFVLSQNYADDNIVKTYSLFIANWIQFALSTISITGMMRGIEGPNQSQNQIDTTFKKDIQIHSLSVANVFRSIEIDIKYGSKVVLAGVNGSGKTLLCRIIAGAEPRIAKMKHRCHFIDNSNIVFDNEKLMLANNSMWQRFFVAKYSNLLQQERLSKGQMNLILIATIALHDSDIIILDEVLDVITNSMLDDVLSFLNSLPSTVLIVSHRPDIIEKLPIKLMINNQEIKII